MIRYTLPVGKTLEQLVDEHNPTWRSKHRAWNGTGNPWSDLKPVFSRLQGGKCAYCERRLQARPDENKRDIDVEHYRPKKPVTLWGSVATGRKDGYDWLATNPANYLLACKTCNSDYKGNRFPIAGKAGLVNTSVAALDAREQPFLPYPIGQTDPDIEDILDWSQILVPEPKPIVHRLHLRGQVMIDFFELDRREDLVLERAYAIERVWGKLLLWQKGSSAERQRLEQELAAYQTDFNKPHLACSRAFLLLAFKDPQHAEKIALAAGSIIAESLKQFS